ncbi:hypothetical protein Tco_0841715 [Tanacetum coccineum]|uniref:Uncharacterized protein n=1 Tax=Tanacetum coccineum TaxID=301880 RepID=A0ABQ5AYH2_9ASTR
MITTTKKPSSSSSSSASNVTMHDVIGSDVSSDEGLLMITTQTSAAAFPSYVEGDVMETESDVSNDDLENQLVDRRSMTFPHMFHNADEANFLGSGVTKEVTVSSKDRRQKDKGVLSLLPSMELESDSTGIFFSVASARRRIE